MAIEVSSGQLKRMLILAFSDSGRKTLSGLQYQLMLNPTDYSRKYGIKYSEVEASSPTQQLIYSRTPPEELTTKFTVDGTGTTGIPMQVTANVQLFLRVCKDMNPASHRPNYLKIIYGDTIFNCVFKSADIQYTLFHPTGIPLRAEISATFLEQVDIEKETIALNPQSPDLTHVRVVKQGDNLPMLTKEVYGDSKYYIDVARFNKITSFRNIKAGDRIVFPPLS